MNDEQIKAELKRHLGGEWRKLLPYVWGSGNRAVQVEPAGQARMVTMGATITHDSIAQLADRLRVLRDTLATIPNKPLPPPMLEPVKVMRDINRPVTVAISPEQDLIQLRFTDNYDTRNFTPDEWDRVTEAAAPMVAWIREHGEG